MFKYHNITLLVLKSPKVDTMGLVLKSTIQSTSRGRVL